MTTNFSKFILSGALNLSLLGLTWLFCPAIMLGQDAAKLGPDESKDVPAISNQSDPAASTEGSSGAQAGELEEELETFRDMIAEWKDTIVEINSATIRYRNSSGGEGPKLKAVHRELEIKGREQFEAAFEQALRITKAFRDANEEVNKFLLFATHYRYSRDIYEKTGDAAATLIDIGDSGRGLPEVAGVSYFAVGELEKARPYLEQAVSMGLLDEKNRGLLNAIDMFAAEVKAEQNQRKQDAEKGDLPRVKLTTTRGEIILELFEDQAPNTVANFITLVEEGVFRGIPFYQVISAEVALVGDTRATPDSLGFVIADECHRPDARFAMRGHLCMAKLPIPQEAGASLRTVPNSASSHFFIALRPIFEVPKEYTAFGRIVEGMTNCSVLTRINPNDEKKEGQKDPEPDLILDAEVIRRRDHSYTPDRVDLAEAQAKAVAPPASAN